MRFKILLLVVFTSCKKNTDTGGKLSYKLLDDARKGLPNVKVFLFEDLGNFSNTQIPLKTAVTDKNGLVLFTNLDSKKYLVVADSAFVNKVRYQIQDPVQASAGTLQSKEVRVSDFSGYFNITVKTLDSEIPLENMNVVAVPYESKYFNVENIDGIIDAAASKGISDNKGLVTIKVPSNIKYSIVCHEALFI